jgi:PAS domain-containing protein
VERRRPKHIVLILAREFASNLATPTLIADAAEELAGAPFSEVGEMPVDEWTARFQPRTLETEPLPPERRPVRMALDERRAAHTNFMVTSADGVEREIAVTAFPLFAHADEFVGIVGIFWGESP